MRRVLEEEADFLEVGPETLWAAGCAPGPRWDGFLDLVRRSGLPVVGHGVDFSLGSPPEGPRAEAWLAAIRRDHEALSFEWYGEHLGFTQHDGAVASLPLPLPPTDEAVRAVAASVARLREIVPLVVVENQVSYFALGDAAREPEFLNAVCETAGCGLLLDLHNAVVQCANLGLDASRWLDALDLRHVVEIHVSGGSVSDPAWLPSGRTLRLDSHDGPVPEDVWTRLAWTLPRCPNLRGVVLERLDGTLREEDVPAHEADVRRLRAMLC
jgi:hypothetical protein